MPTRNASPDPEAPGVALLARRTDLMDPERLRETLALLERDPRVAETVVTTDRDRMRELAPRVVAAAGTVPPEILRAMERLAWYQQWGAGADWLLEHDWARGAPFTLTNVAGIHGVQIGEHVMMGLLALGRGLPAAVLAQRERAWSAPDDGDVIELEGRRMLLLGYGGLGVRIARLASAFGMTVDVIRRTAAEAPPGVERVGVPADLDAFLPDADDVVITLPLTRETRGLFGPGRLARMRRGARLVNVGRGGIVDEAALARALEAGELAGAALDVFEEEPLPPSSPLWDAPNLLLTAHWAGATRRYDERALEVLRENARRFAAGEELTHVVDKELGY